MVTITRMAYSKQRCGCTNSITVGKVWVNLVPALSAGIPVSNPCFFSPSTTQVYKIHESINKTIKHKYTIQMQHNIDASKTW